MIWKFGEEQAAVSVKIEGDKIESLTEGNGVVGEMTIISFRDSINFWISGFLNFWIVECSRSQVRPMRVYSPRLKL
jgi:hypothetical protein